MIAAGFPSLLQGFFTERLLRQRQASSHTIAGYRDTFRLLLRFAADQLGKAPSTLKTEDFQPAFVGRFLEHLEQSRATVVGPAMRVWPRFTRFFGMSNSPNRHPPCSANRCWRCPANVTSASPSRFSTARRSLPSSLPPIGQRGSAVATGPCWPSPSKPVCASRN